eukprot:38881-Chlamydomonas_euryale.AAC.1
MDRLDIVLGLLAAQLSVKGPAIGGILLTRAGAPLSSRRYARDAVSRIFQVARASCARDAATAAASISVYVSHTSSPSRCRHPAF